MRWLRWRLGRRRRSISKVSNCMKGQEGVEGAYPGRHARHDLAPVGKESDKVPAQGDRGAASTRHERVEDDLGPITDIVVLDEVDAPNTPQPLEVKLTSPW